MVYTYEGALEQQEDGWFATVPAFPGVFHEGRTVNETCEGAAVVLQLSIAEYIDTGLRLPTSEFSNAPQVVFCVDVTKAFIAESKCMVPEEAASELGITVKQVADLLDAGLLEPYQSDDQQMITIANINAYKRERNKGRVG